MTVTVKRSTDSFTLIALEDSADRIIDAPAEFCDGFRCGVVLAPRWKTDWLQRQVRSLLHQGAKLFYFYGERAQEAEELAESVVIEEDQQDVAVLHNDRDIIDFLWKFRLVYDPQPEYLSALSSYLLIKTSSAPAVSDWKSLIDEVFPI